MGTFVSILIPCYNAEQWIEQAIDSALAQTWPEKEIIVVDDGSTDHSLDIIQQFDGRIRWEAGPNRGSNATRNRLLDLACGEWLQYLDADDYLLPGKLARQIEFAREHTDSDVIYSPVAWDRIEQGVRVCTETPIPELRDPWILLALWRLPQTGGSIWRKAVLESVGGWRVDQSCCQEHELYCRLLEANARFEYCAGCLAVYCDLEHDGRITRSKPRGEFVRQRLAILDRIEKHLEQHFLLTPLRRQAVNDARHELARSLWGSDRQQAVDTHRRILTSDPSFIPGAAAAASSPQLYSIAYRILGFQGAQIAASFKRALGLY
jgi:glycosyltransferase involved in cell wall biosynthesis